MSKKPLEGIRVLDFTNALAGPYCSMMLGNMGAEVIKVEKPGTGDDSRGYGPFVNGQSGYFVSVNHGKKSVVCNTKDPEGVEMFKDLVKLKKDFCRQQNLLEFKIFMSSILLMMPLCWHIV